MLEFTVAMFLNETAKYLHKYNKKINFGGIFPAAKLESSYLPQEVAIYL